MAKIYLNREEEFFLNQIFEKIIFYNKETEKKEIIEKFNNLGLISKLQDGFYLTEKGTIEYWSRKLTLFDKFQGFINSKLLREK